MLSCRRKIAKIIIFYGKIYHRTLVLPRLYSAVSECLNRPFFFCVIFSLSLKTKCKSINKTLEEICSGHVSNLDKITDVSLIIFSF